MENNTFKVFEYENVGEVRVTEEVIAKIAGLAATEVEGVECLANNITNEIISRLGAKNLAAGVDVVYKNGRVNIYFALVIRMGAVIPEVCRNVQEKVKAAVEGMTGMKVGEINIKIANIKVDK